MRKFVITLAKTPERLEAFHMLNKHIPDIEPVAGIDGVTIENQELLRDSDIFSPDLSYTNGALGCALSHINLWRQCLHQGRPITVFEDDAITRLDFDAISNQIFDALPPDPDFIAWGWNLDCPVQYDLIPGVTKALSLCGGKIDNPILFQAGNTEPNAHRLDFCFGTPAYTITPNGACKLLTAILPLKNFAVLLPAPLNSTAENKGIDVAMLRAYPEINAYLCVPPLALSPNEAEKSLTR